MISLKSPIREVAWDSVREKTGDNVWDNVNMDTRAKIAYQVWDTRPHLMREAMYDSTTKI